MIPKTNATANTLALIVVTDPADNFEVDPLCELLSELELSFDDDELELISGASSFIIDFKPQNSSSW